MSGEGARRKLCWFLLSAAGCVLFLSVTNIITYEIVPCPLLWVIPLCLYLASFTLTFRDRPVYPRWIGGKFHLVMGFSVLVYFFVQGRILPVMPGLIAFAVALFALCMFCQHELYESRPAEKDGLTGFYLIVSLGGFAGSMVVTWIVPRLFTSTVEFLLGLFLIGLSLALKEGFSRIGFYRLRLIAYVVVLVIAWPMEFKQYNVFGVGIALIAFAYIFRDLVTNRTALALCLLIVFAMEPFVDNTWTADGRAIHTFRNYYGIYEVRGERAPSQVRERDDAPRLAVQDAGPRGTGGAPGLLPPRHARGEDPGRRPVRDGPGRGRGSGRGGRSPPTGRRAGRWTFSSWTLTCRPSSLLSTTSRSPGRSSTFITTTRGSPCGRCRRLSTTSSSSTTFSGDSVPVHLLTTEAIREYRARVKDGGLILFHISNRYIDLAPVIVSNARAVGAFALFASNTAQGSALLASDWAALTWNRRTRDALTAGMQWQDRTTDAEIKPGRPWTDKYSNLPSVMKPRVLVNSLRDFQPFKW